MFSKKIKNEICPICKVSLNKETLQVSIKKIYTCPVCHKDVKNHGKTNGIGFVIFKLLIRKYGSDLVYSEWYKNEVVNN